ncbi:MAG: DUF2017 family protein [Actinomycetota bacterium]
MRGPFKRARDGRYKVMLGAAEREVLATLPDQLRGVLADPGDKALARLFPAAITDDPVGDAEFTMRTQGDLTDGRLAGIETFERTMTADKLTEDELLAWLRTLNDLRLVLGVRLDITEDTNFSVGAEDPRLPGYELYRFLTWLVDSAVEALPV